MGYTSTNVTSYLKSRNVVLQKVGKPTAGSSRVFYIAQITVIWWAGQPVGVDMEGVVNSESVPTSLIQVADSHRNIFLFRYPLSLSLKSVRVTNVNCLLASVKLLSENSKNHLQLSSEALK
jgi:hypothetical protein